MKLSRPVRSAVAALALAGAVAVPAQAADAHPLSVPTRVSASTPTPDPAPFHEALLHAARSAASTGAPGGTTGLGAAPRSAGIRPIGSGVSTDLPTRVDIGNPFIVTSYTVRVPTSGYRRPAVQVALVSARGDLVWQTFTAGAAGQTAFRGTVTVPAGAVGEPGAFRWVVIYGEADTQSDNLPTAALGTTIKLRTLLAQQLTRRSSDIRVFGALKQYDFSLRYSPRATARVVVQRWSTSGYGAYRRQRAHRHQGAHPVDGGPTALYAQHRCLLRRGHPGSRRPVGRDPGSGWRVSTAPTSG